MDENSEIPAGPQIPPPTWKSVSEPPVQNEWKWSEADADICVKRQMEIAIYQCQTGDIIIRQQDEMWDEEREAIIWINPQNLQAVIDKLVKIQESIDA